MPRIYFITHPEVRFDWTIPVPQWDLSDKGRARLEVLARQPWVKTLDHLFASTEQKAVTTARRLSEICRPKPVFMPDLGEIDRSRAGTLSPEEYSRVTDAFFAHPDQSANHWERAVDAQARIVNAVQTIIERAAPTAIIAIVSHGGVGTLLLCHLKKIPIARKEDQPSQGHYFQFDTTGKIAHAWKPIDDLTT